jgi:hypothetical protein
VPITVRWKDQTAAANKAEKSVEYEVLIPSDRLAIDTADDNHLNLRIVANVRTMNAAQVEGVSETADGHLKLDSVQRLQKDGFLFKGSISLPPGRDSVRFVARDNIAERIGSVAAPVVVR